MKNLVVLLGAGASTGSVKPGSNSTLGWTPPVTKDIFNIRFNSILNRFDHVAGFSGINDELEDGASLESYLKTQIGTNSRYASLSSNRKLQINQLPLYLQALFTNISEWYASSSYYHRLVNHILDKEINVTFITLNYDLLLDYAIEKATGITIDAFAKYFAQQDKWVLIKPHGSINWFRQIMSTHGQDGYTFESWKSIVSQINITTELDSTVYFADLDAKHQHGFRDGFINNTPFYPALAIPNGEYEMVVPVDNFRDIIIRRLNECENFLFIGFSAYDWDILNILHKNVRKVSKLLVVGNANPLATYDRLINGAPIFTRDSTFTAINAVNDSVYGGGFGNLIKVKSNGYSDLDNFLNSLN